MILVKEISAEETYDIRLKVLRNGINLPCQFDGDFDSDTFHLGVFEGNQLAGISSFVKTKKPSFDVEQYQLRGMATLPETRGKGYGKLMLQKSFELLKNRSVKTIWCNAREIALHFYLKQDFKILGKPFDIDEIGIHYLLYKNF